MANIKSSLTLTTPSGGRVSATVSKEANSTIDREIALTAGEFVEGRLKGVSPRKKVVELEFVFDADDLSDERYPGLAQNELIELEAVGIGQACACSGIDL